MFRASNLTASKFTLKLVIFVTSKISEVFLTIKLGYFNVYPKEQKFFLRMSKECLRLLFGNNINKTKYTMDPGIYFLMETNK